ncbi:MAG: flagellar basal body P-ring protein FlgI [Rhodospirillales bacterium]|nr:flagellar basal body P-ring protein FlgI [Rhodospirillales bacterium]USO08112.1 MAG: flagellar basal body P-ring protein FlgI [Rhodospirillales bacterium]
MRLRKFTLSLLVLAALAAGISMPAAASGSSRIKDIVDIEGVRDNMLIGYGLVVGLNGTGDKLNNAPFTKQSLTAMLERLGVNVRDQNLNTGNVAAVMVTGTLPPFTNQGARIDVNVSTLGDAKSLQGGTLLVTPLMAGDGEVYAVAQGPVTVSGFAAGGDAGTVTQNIPTAGRVPNGAIVEKEIGFDMAGMATVRLSLRNPDFTTARRIAATINQQYGAKVAQAENNASVKVTPPTGKSVVDTITDIEQFTIEPDQVAKIVIDERSGVIVMGADVRISTVAVAQGNLTVRITETPQVSQPAPFSQQGTTTTVPRTNIDVNTPPGNIAYLPAGVTLQELVSSLNALGVTPRDVITILQAIKAAGAIQAEIEVL